MHYMYHHLLASLGLVNEHTQHAISSLCIVYSVSIGVLGRSRYGVDHDRLGWTVSHPSPWLPSGFKSLVQV